MKENKKIKRYQLIYPDYDELADNLFTKGYGGISSLDVLIHLLKIARKKNEKIEFELPNFQVINMDEVQKMIDKDLFNE